MLPVAAAPFTVTTAALQASAVACRRGDRLLFQGLDLVLRPGQIVWLRGSNGRGKTSLLRLLAGLALPEGGSIRWGDEAPRSEPFAQGLLYLAHANALKEDLTAAEALGFLAAMHGQASDSASLQQALLQVGLGGRSEAPVRTLSQGQRRRVALARLLLAPRKPLWVLDEPYDALDAQGISLIDGLVAGHAKAGGAVVLTSHLPLTITDPAPLELHLPESVA
jgi:heme exporter protein A